jgi:hypothetical protein
MLRDGGVVVRNVAVPVHRATKKEHRVMTASTIPPTGTTAGAGKGSRFAAELDRKLASSEPLLKVADWYAKTYFVPPSIDEWLSLYAQDCTANEFAALSLTRAGYQSEAEIATRPCSCIRREANVCRCYARLKAARTVLALVPEFVREPVLDHDNSAVREFTHEEIVKYTDMLTRELADMMREVLRSRGDKVIPHEIGLLSAMLFLAPLGNELAQDVLAAALRARPASQMKYDPTPLPERRFQNRRYITLLYAAFAAHPDYANCDPASIIRRWQELDIAEIAAIGLHFAGFKSEAAVESAYLVDWFCATHPTRARRIERDVKIKMRKQGWHV